MKTYTKEEYINHYSLEFFKYKNKGVAIWTWWYKRIACSCIDTSIYYGKIAAYKECKNCYGLGIPPIPISEIK